MKYGMLKQYSSNLSFVKFPVENIFEFNQTQRSNSAQQNIDQMWYIKLGKIPQNAQIYSVIT